MNKSRMLNDGVTQSKPSAAGQSARQGAFTPESLFFPIVLTPEMTTNLHLQREIGVAAGSRRWRFVFWGGVVGLSFLPFFTNEWFAAFLIVWCALGYGVSLQHRRAVKRVMKFYHVREIPPPDAVGGAAIDQLFARRHTPTEAVLESLWHTAQNPAWLDIARRIVAIRSCCYKNSLLTPHPEDHFFFYFHRGDVGAEAQFLRILDEEFGMTLPRDCADDIDRPWTLWQIAAWLESRSGLSSKVSKSQ